MAYRDDQEEDRDSNVMESPVGEVLDEDGDEEDPVIGAVGEGLLDDEKAWE